MRLKQIAVWVGSIFVFLTLLSACAGETGEQGEQGVAGPQGPAGEKGPQGDPGVAGQAGANGDPGEKGPKGDTGDQGPKGDQGDPGPTQVSSCPSTLPTPESDWLRRQWYRFDVGGADLCVLQGLRGVGEVAPLNWSQSVVACIELNGALCTHEQLARACAVAAAPTDLNVGTWLADQATATHAFAGGVCTGDATIVYDPVAVARTVGQWGLKCCIEFPKYDL
jgi:hypothetical protein